MAIQPGLTAREGRVVGYRRYPAAYRRYGHRNFSTMFGPTKRTTSPIVTGTSVIAIKYSGGVMMSADTQGVTLARVVLAEAAGLRRGGGVDAPTAVVASTLPPRRLPWEHPVDPSLLPCDAPHRSALVCRGTWRCRRCLGEGVAGGCWVRNWFPTHGCPNFESVDAHRLLLPWQGLTVKDLALHICDCTCGTVHQV